MQTFQKIDPLVMTSVGAKCDHFKLEVRTHLHAHLNLDVQGACMQPKKRLQLTLLTGLPKTGWGIE